MKYEDAYQELQQIVQALQNGQIGVDELSDKIKRAAELIDFCKKQLRNTENDLNQLFEEA
ncbi:MAG: exodeoxyribonuclease VII small subunit [Saprospiraceae bacterium]|nr:exodeoxyribonuclease VII small subunit [Saprospiraceae bacterium]